MKGVMMVDLLKTVNRVLQIYVIFIAVLRMYYLLDLDRCFFYRKRI